MYKLETNNNEAIASMINPDGSPLKIVGITPAKVYENGFPTDKTDGYSVEIVVLGGDFSKYRVRVPEVDTLEVGLDVELVNPELTIYPKKGGFELGLSLKCERLLVVGGGRDIFED